ncbi:MAG: PIN domain-containing protein [Promethearchaeota archaeon]
MDGAPSLKNNTKSNQSTQVLLDTNFLLLPFQRRFDIYEEIPRLIGRRVTFLVMPQILKEIEWLQENGKTRERNAAKNALHLVYQNCQLVENLPKSLQNLNADRALLQYAKQINAIVATNDGDLRRKLVKQGSRAIFLRKLSVLALTE